MVADGSNRDDHLRQLVHDIQTSLHAIGMGTELLKEMRDDDGEFVRICDSIDKERKDATELVKELFKAARMP